MGRPERPLDPASGPVQLFASQLRKLRHEAGLPTYRTMAARTGYSAAALSRAAAGERFPTLEATQAFVRACGGDAPQWRLRWQQARDAAKSAPLEEALSREAGNSGGSEPALPRPQHGWLDSLAAGLRHRRRLAVMAVGLAGVLILLGLAVQAVFRPAQVALSADPSAGYTALHPRDGADPYVSRCAVDQERIEQRTWPILWPSRRIYGYLILYHSGDCHASWGYVYGPNSPKWTVVIITRRLGEDPASTIASFRGEAPPDSWGTLLSDSSGCVRAEAYVITASARGPTAVTGCWQENGPVRRGILRRAASADQLRQERNEFSRSSHSGGSH